MQGQVPLLGAYLAQADARADPESVALARQRLAQLELLNGHAERAGPLLGLAQSQWASDPRRYREQRLEGLNIQGQLLRARGELPAATQVFELAVAERQALGGPVQRELAVLNNSLATTLMAANQPERALAAYRQALAIYEQLGQAESVDALVVLGNTGTLAMRTGRLNEALPTLQRAFTLQRERAGDSAAVGAAMGLYGMALTAKGQSATAIGVLHQAIDIALRFTAATSPLVVQNRLFLTEALAEAGDLPAARALAQANANAAREAFGPAHLFSLRTQSALARLMLRSGQVKDAQLADEALLPALRKLGPPAQGALAAALLDLGESSLAARQPLQAQTQLRQAVALREQLLWPQSWELAQARERLGEALLSSDTAAALALLKPAAETLAHELGEAHAETRRARAAQASAVRS